MSSAHCEREDELLDALTRGFVGAELETHIASCTSCSELQLVAGALLEDRVAAIAEASVPSAGAMLWRMRVRARNEAESRARQSLLIGQASTLLIAIGMVVAFFHTQLASLAHHLDAILGIGTPFLLVAATWLLIAPIAGWVAIRQK